MSWLYWRHNDLGNFVNIINIHSAYKPPPPATAGVEFVSKCLAEGLIKGYGLTRYHLQNGKTVLIVPWI